METYPQFHCTPTLAGCQVDLGKRPLRSLLMAHDPRLVAPHPPNAVPRTHRQKAAHQQGSTAPRNRRVARGRGNPGGRCPGLVPRAPVGSLPRSAGQQGVLRRLPERAEGFFPEDGTASVTGLGDRCSEDRRLLGDGADPRPLEPQERVPRRGAEGGQGALLAREGVGGMGREDVPQAHIEGLQGSTPGPWRGEPALPEKGSRIPPLNQFRLDPQKEQEDRGQGHALVQGAPRSGHLPRRRSRSGRASADLPPEKRPHAVRGLGLPHQFFQAETPQGIQRGFPRVAAHPIRGHFALPPLPAAFPLRQAGPAGAAAHSAAAISPCPPGSPGCRRSPPD